MANAKIGHSASLGMTSATGNLHRNYIDHAEYPQTAEIEQRCIRMLANLYHAPGETTGTRTQGSSEAIMLGALSLKWKWRARREAGGKDTTRPNLVFGGDVHVVWEKFCRYFDVEPASESRGPVGGIAPNGWAAPSRTPRCGLLTHHSPSPRRW
jgi:glutamate/tyrosine decarboxylase-like PLP-dependent enzyme